MVVIPFEPTQAEPKPDTIAYTELSQAKKFVDLSNDTLRYVDKIDQWFRWNGYYWKVLSKLIVIENIRQMNRQDALGIDEGKGPRKQICSLRFSRNVEGFCRGDPRCLLELEQLDADPWLLGTPGGIIDLRTGRAIAMGLRPYVTLVGAVEPADVAGE